MLSREIDATREVNKLSDIYAFRNNYIWRSFPRSMSHFHELVLLHDREHAIA